MSLKVTIDDPEREYFPLESFLGKIHLDLVRDCNIEVAVRLIGEEHVEYTAPRTSTLTKPFTGVNHHSFLESRYIQVHSGYAKAGFYMLPFNVTVPEGVPSTYVGEDGHVKYLVKAFVDQLGQKAETEVKVSSPINVNELKLEKSLFYPSTHFKEKLLVGMLCWWCLHEMIEMEVRLERRVFVLGDTVNVSVMVMNPTFISIDKLQCRLFVKISAKASTPGAVTSNSYNTLAYSVFQGVPSHSTGSCFANIKIPSDLKLPNFKRCAYFRQTLVLEVTAVLKARSDLKLEVNLILAHRNADKIKAAPIKTLDEIKNEVCLQHQCQ